MRRMRRACSIHGLDSGTLKLTILAQTLVQGAEIQRTFRLLRLFSWLSEGVRGGGRATEDPLRRRLQSTVCGPRQRPLFSGRPGRASRLEGSRSFEPKEASVRYVH